MRMETIAYAFSITVHYGSVEDPKSPRASEEGEASGTRLAELCQAPGVEGSRCRHFLTEIIGVFSHGSVPMLWTRYADWVWHQCLNQGHSWKTSANGNRGELSQKG